MGRARGSGSRKRTPARLLLCRPSPGSHACASTLGLSEGRVHVCDCCACASVRAPPCPGLDGCCGPGWGPPGPPLLRLWTLDGADGRFPFTLLQAPPQAGREEPPGGPKPHSYAAALPGSMSPGGKRPQLPLWGLRAGPGLWPCFLLPEGRGRRLPGGQALVLPPSLPSSSLEPSAPPRLPAALRALPGPSAARRTPEQAAWRAPRLTPPLPRICAMTLGKSP